jgi:ELWxxDGT repeat protein
MTTTIFAANDGTNGRELWVTDGTAADTQLLMNINPAAGSSSITTITTISATNSTSEG